MNLLRFLFSKIFLLNLLIAILLGSGLIYGFFQFLEHYTHHNEALSVPDLRGMKLVKVKKVINNHNLRFTVNDSIFVPDKPKLTVIEQNPKPFSKVKRNRKIYLTVNSPHPPKVEVPDLKDVSLRQALAILETYGLNAGELEYVPDIAQNVVKEMKLDDKTLEPKEMVPKGTSIDLVLGDGLTATKVNLPDLKGATLGEATFFLNAKGLNTGAILYDKEVEDSTEAIIYKQRPLYKPEKKVAQGEAIDIWLTTSKKYKKMHKGRAPHPADSLKRDENQGKMTDIHETSR